MLCRCGCASATPLAEHAARLSSQCARHSQQQTLAYPMYTVPQETFLEFSKMRPHEELLRENVLVLFEETKGRGFFISHQWVGVRHPDPEMKQLVVLQDALRQMMSGCSTISIAPTEEMLGVHRKGLSTKKLQSGRNFLWYDYFSCPQLSEEDLEKSVDSIPGYITRCEYLFVLCPVLTRAEGRETMNKDTWGSRGWCLAEHMAGELCGVNDKVIVVESATHITMATGYKANLIRPGEGMFSFNEDREAVARFLRTLIENKLTTYLKEGKLHKYRFLWSQQRVRLDGLPTEPIEHLVPGFDAKPGENVVLANFLYQNGFTNVNERDSNGWSPLLYAALGGNPVLIRQLLESAADPNDKTRKATPSATMRKGHSVLAVVAFLKHNRAMDVLLEFKACVNLRDPFNHISLHDAAAGNNMEGTLMLLQARADTTVMAMGCLSPLMVACAEGSVNVAKVLVPFTNKADLTFGLQLCSCFSGSAELTLLLIEAGANVDEPFRPTWALWFLLQISKLHHRRHPSRLSMLAQNHSGATPLMCSILSGAFEAATTLITAGARVDICNSKKKTAVDLAREVLAPDFVMDALIKQELKLPSGRSVEFARYFWEASQPSSYCTF